MTNPSCPLWTHGLVGLCLVLDLAPDSEGLQDKASQLCGIASNCYLSYLPLCYVPQRNNRTISISDSIWWYGGLQAKFNILPYTFHRHQTRSTWHVWLRKMDPMTFEIAWNLFHNWVKLIGNYAQKNCCFLDIFKHFHNLQNIVFGRKTEYRISWTPFKMFYLSLCFPSFLFSVYSVTVLRGWLDMLWLMRSCY